MLSARLVQRVPGWSGLDVGLTCKGHCVNWSLYGGLSYTSVNSRSMAAADLAEHMATRSKSGRWRESEISRNVTQGKSSVRIQLGRRPMPMPPATQDMKVRVRLDCILILTLYPEIGSA